MAIGDSLYNEVKPAEALKHYLNAVAVEPGNFELLWRISRTQADVASTLSDKGRRDNLYALARSYGETAIRADSARAEGYFVLARALGLLARTKGSKERVKFAKQIYDAASKALERDPNHDGAHHVIGAWHAEILRLSGVARFFAKTFLGADFFGIASWDSAATHLERAVAIDPRHVFHRLELAEIYIDLKRYGDARQQLTTLLELPDRNISDPAYKKEARKLLKKIKDK